MFNGYCDTARNITIFEHFIVVGYLLPGPLLNPSDSEITSYLAMQTAMSPLADLNDSLRGGAAVRVRHFMRKNNFTTTDGGQQNYRFRFYSAGRLRGPKFCPPKVGFLSELTL